MLSRALVPAMLVLWLVSVPAAALSQAEPLAPVPSQPTLLSGRTAVAAGLILAATLVADQGLRGQVQEYRGSTSNAVADLGNAFGDPLYVLPVLGAGALAGHLAGNTGMSRTALRAAAAMAIAGGVTTAAKFAVGRSRPTGKGDADDFRPFSGWTSFPSGHTASAFAVATVFAAETRDPWADAALYGAATLTAFARLNDDRHWASDVFVGALVGHLSARWLARPRGGLTVAPGAVSMSLEF